MAAAPKLLRARTSFLVAARKGGTKRFVSEGELVDAADPIVRSRASLFEAVEVHAARQAAAKVATARPAPEA